VSNLFFLEPARVAPPEPRWVEYYGRTYGFYDIEIDMVGPAAGQLPDTVRHRPSVLPGEEPQPWRRGWPPKEKPGVLSRMAGAVRECLGAFWFCLVFARLVRNLKMKKSTDRGFQK